MEDNVMESKKGVYDVLITAIDSAVSKGLDEIHVEKKIKVYGKLVTVTISKSEFNLVLQKAEQFFNRTDDYEYCQICKDISQKL